MSNQIRRAREAAGLRQVDLAKLLDVTQATLSNWERGEYEPDNNSLLALSQNLGVTVDFLLGNHPAPTQQKSPQQEAEGGLSDSSGGTIDPAAEFGRQLFAAISVLRPCCGGEKKAYVIDFLNSKGYTLDPKSLDNLIEAAVFNLPDYLEVLIGEPVETE